MAEGTHATSTKPTTSSKQKFALILAGTGVAILAAGVLYQIFRAEPVTAEVDPSAEQSRDAGTARVSGGKRYLARVNNQLITWDEVADECMSRYAAEVLENIVNRTIIQQACEERGIVVSEAEVHQEVVKIAKKFDLPVDTWYQMLHTERNITPLQYQRDIIWPMLALKKLAGEDISVTENDIRQTFVRDFGPKVKARMIMLDNFRRAQQAWEHVSKNPEDFERVAREKSVEPNSRALGGAIPLIRKYAGNKELTDAAFKLKEGEVSGIIQVAPNRFAILLCEGHTEPVVQNLDDVRENLQEQILEEKVQQSVAQVFERIKQDARVDNYITNTRKGGVNRTSNEQNASDAVRQTTGQSSPSNLPGANIPGTNVPGANAQQNPSAEPFDPFDQ